ncbi:ABC transporter substrate-binding protein [Pseudodesulfovibrio nedwellii]|nr:MULTISPECIES: ABC transporter substrate-binding protein [Pseudodesulfovibrio]
MRNLIRTVCVFIFLFGMSAPSNASDKVSVAFLNPAAQGDVFFQLLTDFMQAAADDLGFDLDVYYGGRNHVLIDENVKALFSRDTLPQYIVGMNARGAGELLLAQAEAAGIKTVFINQSFLGEERKSAGRPGEKYTHWLFEYLPDDTHAGYLLARILIEKASRAGLVDADGMINIIAVSGHETSPASLLREEGLREALAEYPNARLRQIIHAGWKPDRAKELSQRLLRRYPDTSVVWAASDAMGAGVAEGVRELGKHPGSNILIGGVDWTRHAQELLGKGDFAVSVGGHFMDGAWALVMMYDAMHGIAVSRASQSHFSSLTARNIVEYKKHFGVSDWRKIDFTKFSKYLNPTLKYYDFGLEAVLDQMETLQ